MKTRIFVVTFASHTASDDNLYSNVSTFSTGNYPKDEQEARSLYDRLKQNAHEECKWGAYWDCEDEEERDGISEYVPLSRCTEITRRKDTGCLYGSYEVESEAYEGYKVSITFEEREVETPCGDIFLFDRERFTEQEAKKMTKAEAIAMAEVSKDERKVWMYHPYCATFESDFNRGSIDPAKYFVRIIY